MNAGHIRRNMFVPMQKFDSIDEYNINYLIYAVLTWKENTIKMLNHKGTNIIKKIEHYCKMLKLGKSISTIEADIYEEFVARMFQIEIKYREAVRKE